MNDSAIKHLALPVLAVACAGTPPPTQSAASPPPTSAAAPALSSIPAGKPVTEASPPAGPEVAAITIENPLDRPRQAATISIAIADLEKLWLDPYKAVVAESGGKELLTQLVDLNGDEAPDELVFQLDLGARESKKLALRFGQRKPFRREDFKVYGRFVRERQDDFAWENDRIARRAYGPKLETYAREPLTSSGLDVWVKRTPRLVINDWYMTADYHEDHGEGGDFYSVGKTRGCGGAGVWSGGKLHASRNFVSSRVLANGPIRLVFELEYAAWDAGGAKVSEVKRVTLDAGQDFQRMESTFSGSGAPLTLGIGIAKHAGGSAEYEKQAGLLRSWEPFKDDRGNLGCAVVVPPGSSAEYQTTDSDFLLIARAPGTGPLVYYTGSAWDRAGRAGNQAAWADSVSAFSRELAAPVKVSLDKAPGARPWAARSCDSVMARQPDGLGHKWEYDSGLVLRGCEQLFLQTGDRKYADYVKKSIDALVQDDGSIKTYRLDEYNIDQINMGKVIFRLYAEATEEREKTRYKKALALLREQMKTHPRTKQGGFWHKKIYPNQMWLDGLYMAAPFLAQYARVFDEPALFDEVTHQIMLIEKLTRDAKTGLLYHGHDESREQRWADKTTGRSPHFWGRAMGWYAMALVDVLEHLPKNHPRRAAVIGVLERLAEAVSKVQDPLAGVWWQVLDAPKKPKNYLEASASSMFVYALGKAVREGWLDQKKYAPVVRRGFAGILKQFVTVDAAGKLDLNQVCKVAGLGGNPYRDGSYEYYTSTEIVSNDPKGVGAFILAGVEMMKN